MKVILNMKNSQIENFFYSLLRKYFKKKEIKIVQDLDSKTPRDIFKNVKFVILDLTLGVEKIRKMFSAFSTEHYKSDFIVVYSEKLKYMNKDIGKKIFSDFFENGKTHLLNTDEVMDKLPAILGMEGNLSRN